MAGVEPVASETETSSSRAHLAWRLTAAPFIQDPRRFEPLISRFPVADAFSGRRVRDIVTSFLIGYNAFASAGDTDSSLASLMRLAPYFRPFAYEGAAMGFGPWALRHRRPLASFEAVFGRLSPATVYQNYVGLGWWLARRRGLGRSTTRLVAGLDPRYQLLVYEGIGFSAGFRSGGRSRALRRLRSFGEPAEHVAHQGFGRSLWFVHMGNLEAAIAAAGALPERFCGDAISGLGLGCAYSWFDRVGEFWEIAAVTSPEQRPDFLQGASFGWEARKRADQELFASRMQTLPAGRRTLIEQAVDTVHRASHELDPTNPSFYQSWRRRTAELIDPSSHRP